nr:reverse transcriptase domain-containing protein [Tanacetum cinerariifolium]
MKKIHDSKIKNRIFNVGDRVLLFNSHLKIFSGKLKTRWSGPFTITKVFPYGTVELSQPDGPNFKVNGHRVKHYFGGDVPQLTKGLSGEFASLTRLESQVYGLHRQVAGLNDKLSSTDAAFAKSKSKEKERKKKIKSLTKSLDKLHAEMARLSVYLNRATCLVWKFLTFDEFRRVQAELPSLAASAGFERGLSMHRTKEEFVAGLKKIS